MSRSLFSSSWYRVAGLKPRLRDHVEIHRHLFRGERWYIVQDPASGRFHRFSPEAHLVIGQMDGRRTVEDIWQSVAAKLGDDLPTQDEVIQLLAQLHGSDLLHADVSPDVVELAERSSKLRRKAFFQNIKNPMAVRLPLLDPDRFLTLTLPLVRPLFTPWGFIVWLGLMVFALVQAGLHWAELTNNISDRVFGLDNLVLIAVTYMVIKALHELGHGYAAKSWGGEIHDMGVMFLVFIPVPYVDASSSSAFRSKWRRAAVAGAGIMVEMSLAAIALFVWLTVEPGFVRAAAFNVMLVGGVSTLLFNGNPLLRFDGYYVFTDLVEIPNLATRANKYFFHLIQRYGFGLETADPGPILPSERKWLFGYAVASFLYRLFILFAIVGFVAARFFFIGVLLAIWAFIAMFGVPIGKGLWFLAASPVLRHRRRRALAVSGAAAACVLGLLFAVPLPYGTVVKGATWVPDKAVLHAGEAGFVAEILAPPGARVAHGQALIALRDRRLEAELTVAEGEVLEYGVRLSAVEFTDPVGAAIVREQLGHARASRDRLRARIEALTLRSPSAGRFVLPADEDLLGRFVKKGERLGFIVDPARPVVRIAVDQADIDPIRNRTRGISVRYAGRLSETLPARLERSVPAATDRVTNRALTTDGGGDIALDPRDPERTLETVFRLDLNLPAQTDPPMIGARAYVRFDHGAEPIAWRLYRRLRQLFLSEFSV